ncbi:MAG TPA: hypothetical protein PK743_14745, partial [Luteimonas sp.]|nr:hypothetical protein [Luteimonas sp.]
MDVLRASQGRVSADGLRGTAARPRERPACCAGPDREAALIERRAIPGRQGAASARSRAVNGFLQQRAVAPLVWEKNLFLRKRLLLPSSDAYDRSLVHHGGSGRMKPLMAFGRLLLPCLLLASCVAVTGERPVATAGAEPAQRSTRGDDMATPPARQDEARVQRFIVFYRAGSAPRQDKAEVPARLARTAAASGLSPSPALAWQRRLAVDADVFTSDRPLDRAEAEALMQAFRDDPEVESIEVDGMMHGGPVETMPMRRGD